MSTANQLIQHLRENVLCVDEDWAVDYETGFCWWPHVQRQDILVCGHRDERAELLEKVAVATKVAILNKDVESDDPILVELAALSTLSGLVIEGRKLRLHAHAWVDQSNLPLYKMVLGTVAGLQISEAAILAALLSKQGLAEPHFSAHPTSGLREEADEISTVLETLIAPMGEEDPPWPENMLDNLRETYLEGRPCLMANSDPTGLTAEFAFGLESSLVRVCMTHKHPIVGHGMQVFNSFNVEELDDPLLDDPIGMNGWEIVHGDGPFLGSWTPAEDGTMSFVSFVPNALQNGAAASNFVLLACARARRMAIKWLNDDWSETWDEEGNCRAKTALERMMGGLPDNL